MAVLKENVDDLRSVTADMIQRSLESRLNVDLAGHEEVIEQVLKSVRDSEDIPAPDSHPAAASAEHERVMRVKKSNVRKNFPFSKSDDEGDRDFDPRGSKKQNKNLNRKKGKE